MHYSIINISFLYSLDIRGLSPTEVNSLIHPIIQRMKEGGIFFLMFAELVIYLITNRERED